MRQQTEWLLVTHNSWELIRPYCLSVHFVLWNVRNVLPTKHVTNAKYDGSVLLGIKEQDLVSTDMKGVRGQIENDDNAKRKRSARREREREWALCCLIAPYLSKDVWCHVRPYSFVCCKSPNHTSGHMQIWQADFV